MTALTVVSAEDLPCTNVPAATPFRDASGYRKRFCVHGATGLFNGMIWEATNVDAQN